MLEKTILEINYFKKQFVSAIRFAKGINFLGGEKLIGFGSVLLNLFMILLCFLMGAGRGPIRLMQLSLLKQAI